MTENLNKKPPKGILKTSSSFDTASSVASPNAGNSGRRNSGVVNSEKNELPEDDDGGGSAPESYVCVRKHSKTAKFDEMNILETYHPATKTYGHMKIEEPKTPFSYYEDADEELEPSQVAARSKESVDADELARKLEETAKRGQSEEEPEVEEESDDDDEEDPESKASRVKFESKRKAHYNEYYAVKLARKLMEQEEDDDEVKGGPPKNHDSEKFIPEEETLVDEDTPEGMQDA